MEDLGAGNNMLRVIAGDSKEFHMNVGNSLQHARLLDQQGNNFAKARDFKALCEGLKFLSEPSESSRYRRVLHTLINTKTVLSSPQPFKNVKGKTIRLQTYSILSL